VQRTSQELEQSPGASLSLARLCGASILVGGLSLGNTLPNSHPRIGFEKHQVVKLSGLAASTGHTGAAAVKRPVYWVARRSTGPQGWMFIQQFQAPDTTFCPEVRVEQSGDDSAIWQRDCVWNGEPSSRVWVALRSPDSPGSCCPR
jgi:hypothetical protein